jgi:general stress protein YciG
MSTSNNQGGSGSKQSTNDQSNANQSNANQNTNQSANQSTSKRGFAAMDPEKQREIASEGGRDAHESGHGHEFTSEEAREAGQHSHDGLGGSQSTSSTTRGDASEQHATTDRQSNKNDDMSHSTSKTGSSSSSVKK